MIWKPKRRHWPIISKLLVLSIGVLLHHEVFAQAPSSAPLIQSNNLTQIGSFKLPAGTFGSTSGFDYAGFGGLGTYAVTYNPTNNSLFIGGHPYEQKLAEVAVPQSLSGVPTASVLQNFKDPLEGKLGSINPGDPNSKIIGSAFVYNNQLYLGGFAYYDGAATQTKSQFVRPINLSTTGQVQGPFTVGNKYPGWVNKYAAIIPSEWQTSFGGPVFVGGSGGAINSLQSWGPSVSVINPSNIGSANPVPATLALGYPYGTPLGSENAANLYWSQSDVIFGVAFPKGSRSVLFFGKHGLGAYCYGTGAECNDPDDSSKGVHNYPYRSQVWAYDANDLIAVKNGQKQAWQVQPYAVWELGTTFKSIQGVGYDPTTQRLYISEVFGDETRPMIRVYQINNLTGSPTAPTPVVTITANPASVLSRAATTLTWSSTNATTCTASGAWSGAKVISSSESTGSLSASSTFSLTCTGAGGSTSQSATVTVTPPQGTPAPTVSLNASPTAITSGSASMLSWTSTNAISCTASGAWSGTKALSGTQSTGALNSTTSYTMSCTGAGGSASQTAAVTTTASTPPLSTSINVSNVSALQSAIAGLTSNKTVLLADGTYNLTGTLYLPQNLSNVTIKGSSGNRANVIIKGPGMSTSSVPFGFWADNVKGLTFQDITIRDIYQHAIILNGGVDNPVFRNLHIIDIGDQFLKNNPTADGLNGVDNGILENSLLEYSTVAPDSYTNGLDVHRGKNWLVRGNTFKNFRSTAGLTGPAILIWNGSSDTTILRNTFINNQRDISLGLDPTKPAGGSTDHARGMIANNFIHRANVAGADVPIAIFDSPQTKVYHNTILVNGGYPYALEYRFSRTTGVDIKNNLTDAAIISRDGAAGTIGNNLTTATTAMFVSSVNGNLHLASTAAAAIDKGAIISVSDDIDGDSRPQGGAPDIGADEYTSGTPPPMVTAPVAPSSLTLR